MTKKTKDINTETDPSDYRKKSCKSASVTERTLLTKKRRHRKRVRITLLVSAILFVLILGTGGFFGYRYYRQYRLEIDPIVEKTIEELNLSEFESQHASVIYYQDSETGEWTPWETLYTSQENEWVHYEDLPLDLINAAVAIEDQRFFEHEGVDWKRTIKVTYEYLIHHDSSQGGSTITQQLIKNLTGNTAKTTDRKAVEILEALELEKKLNSKEKIMELYLNNIYFGNHCTGIYTAANKYFAKIPEDLTLTECACLISVVKNPSLYDPYTYPVKLSERAALVIYEMYKQGYINDSEAVSSWMELGYKGIYEEDKKGNKTLNYNKNPEYRFGVIFTDGTQRPETVIEESDHVYSWYMDAVIDKVIDELMEVYNCDKNEANDILYTDGLKIYTCFDPYAQYLVDLVYEDTELLAGYENSDTDERLQSGITVIDNTNGAVVALSGGIGPKENSRLWNRATDTVRSSGSSIKPLAVYAPAIELGLITPKTIMEDSPFMKDEDGKDWPVNASHKYTGNRTVADAVAESINTIAVKTLDRVGIDESYRWMTEKFQFTSIQTSDRDYAPLALGGLTRGVSTYEMAAAYASFARYGIYTKPYLYYRIEDKNGNIIVSHGEDGEKIMSSATVYTMTELMKGVVEKSNGTGTNAKIAGYDCAGKTGTSSDSKDVWFCGFTGYYTAAVWTGYDIAKEIHNCYPNPSAETWRKVMTLLMDGRENVKLLDRLDAPVETDICIVTGLRASEACKAAGCSVNTIFSKGEEPMETCSAHVWVEVCTHGDYRFPNNYCYESVKDTVVIDEDYLPYGATLGNGVLTYNTLVERGRCQYHDVQTYERELEEIRSRTQEIISADTLEVQTGQSRTLNAVSLDGNGRTGGALSFESSDPSIATVDDSGQINGIKEGTVVVTVTADETDNAPSVYKNITVTVTAGKKETEKTDTEEVKETTDGEQD